MATDKLDPERIAFAYTDACACGGWLGYDTGPGEREFTVWHEQDGVRANRIVGRDYLARRGRTIQTHLMVFVENRHAEQRAAQIRKEDEAVLAQQRDPRNWATISGKCVVVTGALQGYTKVSVAKAIADGGGYARDDKVDRNVDLLVIGTRPGAVKQRDARNLGVPTMNEPEFLPLLRRSIAERQADIRAANRPPLVASPAYLTTTQVRVGINSDGAFDPVVRPAVAPTVALTAQMEDGYLSRIAGTIEGRDIQSQTITLRTRRNVPVGERVTIDSTTRGVVRESVIWTKTDGAGDEYMLTIEIAGTTAPGGGNPPRPAPPPKPTKRSPTAAELLARERYQRDERD